MTLPILIECPFEKADGFVFRRGLFGSEEHDYLSVRILPLAALESVEKSKRQGQLQTPYGAVSERSRVALLTVNLLVQEIQSAESKALDKCIPLKAAEEASLEARREKFRRAVWRPVLAPQRYKSFLGSFVPDEVRLRRERDLRGRVSARVKSPGHPIAELSRELYHRASSRLVLWWRRKERNLAAGLFCSSLDAALFALLLSRIAMPRGTAICTRCQKVFTRTRIVQKFCSTRCGNAVRQARRRAKRHSLSCV